MNTINTIIDTSSNTKMSSAAVPPPGVYVPVPTFFKPITAAAHQPEIDVASHLSHPNML